jgi:hypothetical protein
MVLEVDMLRIEYEIDDDRDIHGFRVRDFLWPPLSIILKMYRKPLTAILVVWVLWP